MRLTKKNYFSPKANKYYMSTSQFKAMSKCEAAALAELNGDYVREKTTALLVGSYIDSYFSNELDQFKSENPEIFTKGGELKSDYRQAEYIIARIKKDKLFMLMLSGRKQVVRTGIIAGVPFKIKMDYLLNSKNIAKVIKAFPETVEWFGFGEGAINDLKIMRDFSDQWDSEYGMYVPFVEHWGYDIQGAIYQKIEGNSLPFFISAASKEKPESELVILNIPQPELDAKLIEVEEQAPRFDELKRGIGTPNKCGKCTYCRKTKILTNIIDYREVR